MFRGVSTHHPDVENMFTKKCQNYLSTELFLKFSDEPEMNFPKRFPQSVGNMDDNGLSISGHVNLPA